jgi:hypothetical protein
MARKYNISYEKNPKYFVSWGAGVQSTALGVMSCLGKVRKVDAIITAELFWEHSYTYKIKDFYSKFFEEHGIPVYTVSKGNIREESLVRMTLPIWSSNGGPLRRQCTGDFKIEPIRRKIRELCGLSLSNTGRTRKNSAIMYLGISLDEYTRMKVSDRDWIMNSYPLVDLKITREDCINYLKELNLPVPNKSCCIGCPYKKLKDWKFLKENYPTEFEDAVEYDKLIRNGINPGQGFENMKYYLVKGTTPLGEIDFNTVEKENKEEICDSGYCWI